VFFTVACYQWVALPETKKLPNPHKKACLKYPNPAIKMYSLVGRLQLMMGILPGTKKKKKLI